MSDNSDRPKSFDELCQESGIPLHRDAPPKGMRSNKDLIATLVGAARKVQDRISRLAEENSLLAKENVTLVKKIAALEHAAIRQRAEALSLPEDRRAYLLTGTTG